MYTFLISVIALVLGYIIYGRVIERVFAPDKSRITPAIAMADGVDYVAMPTWKIFMIQFLNIAGTGPIFGAILGALYGPVCYLWIVFGCIFGGAVHDYLSGMISIRNGGESLPDIVGQYLGNTVKHLSLIVTLILLLLVGAVFVDSPAIILGNLTGMTGSSSLVWVGVIIAYYVTATLVPVDKIIGNIYPFFAFAIIFMAIGLLVCLFIQWPSGVPEIWDGLENLNPESGYVFPGLFITIACGAVSGFHATQSPLMARCMKNEKYGRPVFYGSMILEGIIALVWATISSYFFYAGGNVAMNAENVKTAPEVVTIVSNTWLGHFGGILALLGVVFAPISSGDTALRGARLIIADAIHLKQKSIFNRLAISVPIFAIVGGLLWFNSSMPNGFNVIWRYFGWANQTLSVFTLWAITAFLMTSRKGEWYILTMIPAAFMTSVCLTFILTQKIGFGLPESLNIYLGIGIFIASIIIFYIFKNRIKEKHHEL